MMGLLQVLLSEVTFGLSEGFFYRLLIDVVSMAVLLGLIYYPNHKNKEFVFTYFAFNVVIFIVTYLLNKVELSLGAAFGLFAVFTMLRYRTEGIGMKEMTYLFIVIAIGLISAVSLSGYLEIALLNLIPITVAFIFDGNLLMKNELSRVIEYENIELIKPDKRDELISDLKNRTGLDVHNFRITRIDFIRDSAIIRVFYYDK
jgi:hypothetical protein